MHEIDFFEQDDSTDNTEGFEHSSSDNSTLYTYDEWITILNKYWIIFDQYLLDRKKNLKDTLNINFVVGLKSSTTRNEDDINNCQDDKYFIKMDLLNADALIVEGPYIEIDSKNQTIFKYLLIQVINCFLNSINEKSKLNLPLHQRSDKQCLMEYRNSLKFKEFLDNMLDISNHSYIYYDYRFSLIGTGIIADNLLQKYIQEMLLKIKARRINGITGIDDLKFELECQIAEEEKLRAHEELQTQVSDEKSKYEKVYTIMKKAIY